MSAPNPEFYFPPASLTEQAHVAGMDAYRRLVAEAEHDHEAYWGRLAKELVSWRTPFKTVLDASKPPFFRSSAIGFWVSFQASDSGNTFV